MFALADWFTFLGRQAAPNMPGSPYAIKFWPSAPQSSGMKPMNVTSYSCSDVSLGCSCGDCTSSPVCYSTAPPSPHKQGSCSVRIGSLKVKAKSIIDSHVAVALFYLFVLETIAFSKLNFI